MPSGGLAAEAVEQVELGLQVRRRGAGVDPVGVAGMANSAPSATIAGKISRSIDTLRPSGMRSSTDGSST